MSKNYLNLVERFRKISNLEHASTFLSWDQQVMMPAGGNSARSEALAELAGIQHELLTSADMVNYFDNAATEQLEESKQVSLKEMKLKWQQAVCMPSDLVRAQSLATSKCQHEWQQQRSDNNWREFLPNLNEVVSLARQEACIRQEANSDAFKTPYDAMLDLYAAGDTSEFIGKVFSDLKEQLPELLQMVIDNQGTNSKVIHGPFDVDQQTALSKKLMEILGFNFSSGRLDVSAHPFSTGVKGDHRITTRYSQDEFAEAMLATAHETGHASYEAGLPAEWQGLPVGMARSMSVHESQSLLFEKQLFLAKPFVDFMSPKIQNFLPSTGTLSSQELWSYFTKVKPGFIRVEADEVSYPLHVILRHEIESKLINSEIEVVDIPDLWDQGMQDYLNIDTRGNFKDGCMQDIHWPAGAFGYFPSYTLGAFNAAQLFHSIRKEHPDWQARLEKGDVQFVLQWLEINIWSKGSLYTTEQLMTNATGERTNPEYFVEHIRSRYLKGEY